MREVREGPALAEQVAPLLVVAGPTGSGKTELAAALAVRLGGEIVSADSRQVYRRLDAATAKPSAELRARVPHHLIDVAEPSERYDAARFAREAREAIAGIRARGRAPIVCGGTGLYIRALLEGLTRLPPADPALRARLAAREPAALHAELARVDPAAAAAIPPANRQRLVRALEVFQLTGRPLSAHWKDGREGGLGPCRALVLELPADELRARLERRARAMWPALLAELRALRPRGDEPGLASLGYREGLAVVRGELDAAAGLAAMIRATAAYAKRQRTWFRNQLDARSIDPREAALARALAALEDIHEASAA